MFAAAWRIARFDLSTAIRTKRALFALILYILIAIGTGAVAVSIEGSVIAPMRGTAKAVDAMASVDGSGVKKIEDVLVFFLGDADVAHELLDMPLFVAGFFWVTLSFLPFLIAMMSADLVSSEVRGRSARFLLLRCPREALLFGKVMSHGLLVVIATMVANVALFLYALAQLPAFDTVQALTLMTRFWCLSICFGFCYLSLAALVSTLIDSVPVAILALMGILILFSILSMNDALSPLVPSHYKLGLWSPRPATAAISVAAYLGFGVVFLTGAWLRLRGRDL